MTDLIDLPTTSQKYRRIRSFVRREGRMTIAQQRALDECWPHFGVMPSNQPFNFSELFAREAPTILEIGFGMGDSLLAMAREYPQYNFLGIEVHRPGVGSVLHALALENIHNVRVCCHDAVEILQNHIETESLAAALIFFPDPWPKKRHHKRRLIQFDFIDLLTQKILPQGYLHVATDWQNYAEHIECVLAQQPRLIELSVDDLQSTDFASAIPIIERPSSKFERRGKRLGHAIWDGAFVKVTQA